MLWPEGVLINRPLMNETLLFKELLRFFRFRDVHAMMDESIPGAVDVSSSSTDGNEPFGRRSANDRLIRDTSLVNLRILGIYNIILTNDKWRKVRLMDDRNIASRQPKFAIQLSCQN